MESVYAKKEKKHYGAIDDLRTIACVGIVMMHMRANNSYAIDGFLYNKVIPSFTNFVFLFMTVSAFGMCCGYYEKIIENRISVSNFYSKRFKKIWSFFAVLVLLDVIISLSVDAVYEAFADLTLLFGFLPGAGNISVIGVGWFIGLIFVFYLTFPFFCWLIENKRRAWISFGISLIYNFMCANYFDVGRTNILYSGCFFLAGGLIYLYREKIEEVLGNKKWIALLAVAVSVVLYYTVGGYSMMCLLVSITLLIYSVIRSTSGMKSGGVSQKNLLENRFTHFFSGISMEIYLSHMVVFRVLEKLHLSTVLGDGWVQYVVIVICVLAGAAVFAAVMQRVIKVLESKIDSHRVKAQGV